jgi:hypothetical protein
MELWAPLEPRTQRGREVSITSKYNPNLLLLLLVVVGFPYKDSVVDTNLRRSLALPPGKLSTVVEVWKM